MDCPRSSFRQNNHPLFSRAAGNVLAGVPLLFARVVLLLTLGIFRALQRAFSPIHNHGFDLGKALDKFFQTAQFADRQDLLVPQCRFQNWQKTMHPIMSTGAVKVKQHTQQIKRRIAFAVQQDIEQLLFHRSQGGFASSAHGTLSLW